MEILEKGMNLIAKISIAVSAILVSLIFALINVEIICRYFLGISTLIADEYCGYFFAVAMYLGLCYSIYHNRLLKIDLPGAWAEMTSRRTPRVIVALSAIALNGILLVAMYHTLWASWLFKSRSIQASRTLLAIPQAFVLAGIALMFLASVAILFRSFKKKEGEKS
ncbi:MAG: TRAP transporter small permease [Desulfovibrionaceae bacterium]|nr:TRAP transporter small permease [Desulfovibrionaceae bacterium]